MSFQVTKKQITYVKNMKYYKLQIKKRKTFKKIIIVI